MTTYDAQLTGEGMQLLTQRDLEDRWKVSGRTLERWRAQDYGPAWIGIGGSIRYRLVDVEAFETRHRKGPRG